MGHYTTISTISRVYCYYVLFHAHIVAIFSGVPRGVLRVLEHPPQRKVVGLLTNSQPLREEATHTKTEIYNL